MAYIELHYGGLELEEIYIFGGTFNPVHNGHEAIVKSVINNYNKNLIIMPAGLPPHKNDVEVSSDIRYEMCKLLANKFPETKVSDTELNGNKNYTFITAEKFLLKNIKPCLVIGGDSLRDIFKWKKPEWLLQNVSFLVFKRKDSFSVSYSDLLELAEKYKKLYNAKITVAEDEIPNVSSTEIRIRKIFNLSCENLMPLEIERFVDEHNLYRKYINIIDFLKNNLKEKRYIHTANVAVTAVKINKKLNLPQEKVILAAILHDMAKYIDAKTAFEKGFVASNKDFNKYKNIRHQYVGAFLAAKLFGIEDEDVLNAVKYHTTGRANMSMLEKLIYTADCIEPGRNFEGVQELRKTVENNFEEGFKECLYSTYFKEMQEKGELAAKTIEAVNYYCPEKINKI